MVKRWVGICVFLVFMLTTGVFAATDKAAPAPNSWTVYLYLCGSNLETQDGSATRDLGEIVAAPLPENVKVLVETGGAKVWKNNSVDPKKIQRFVHTGAVGNFVKVDEQPDANMSDASTLKSFLEYGKKNYPAEHNMFIFWDHGGGSVAGAISDERYPGASMSLNDMRAAFAEVYPNADEKKPFDIIGFDACLMATIDTAHNFQDYADYLTASEETMPGNGLYYTPWLNAIAQNPQIDGAELGKIMCDSYLAGCAAANTDRQATYAVIDLNQLDPLWNAYTEWGNEALKKAADAPGPFLTEYARCANVTENYGGNRPNTGYSNMADLGDFVQKASDILPTHSQDVMNGLESSVVYKVNGPYRKNSKGLSCYYLYGMDIDNLKGYFNVKSASEPFKYLYSYMASGTSMEPTVKEYLQAKGIKAMPKFATLKTNPLEDTPVTILADGTAQLTLGGPTAAILKDVQFILINVQRKDDLAIVLGFDNNIRADWEKGIFRDNFLGKWGALDHHFVYMDIVESNPDYTIYASPVKINGENYNLFVAYDYQKSAYSIIGARKGITDYNTAAKGLRMLKEGDKVTTVWCMARLSTPNDLRAVDAETFTIGKNPIFADELLTEPKENETFAFVFEMNDLQNNSAFSKVVFFTMKDGKMFLSDGFLE